jgi:hypothetical protein
VSVSLLHRGTEPRRHDVDPYAGDDEVWDVDEILHWSHDAVPGSSEAVGFFRALTVVAVLGVLAWAGIAVTAGLAVYRLLGQPY